MDLGDRLKVIRKYFNETQAQFAQRLGVKLLTIFRYEKGERSPGAEFLNKLSDIIRIDINWLLTGKGEMFISERKTVSTNNVHVMPIEAEIAAGEPDKITGLKLDTYALDKALIPDVSNSLCFRVNGHNMEPGIEHQDIVIINKDNNWEDKDRVMCAVIIDGEIALKRIIDSEKDKKKYLVANSKDYPPRSYDPKHPDVTLIGTLQMVIRSVK